MPHGISWVVIGVLVVWSIYRRIRRTIGFQPLRTKRFIFRVVLFLVVGVLYLVGTALHPTYVLYALIGLVIGCILTYFAIRTTEFEQRENGWYYRPNIWIGTALIVFFLGRLIYRGFEISKQIQTGTVSQHVGGQPLSYSGDPLTASFLFALIAYYVGYSIFLIRSGRKRQMS